MKKRVISSILLVAALCCQPMALAQSGRAVITNIDTLFTSWNGYKVDPQFATQAARLIDYQGMARQSIGPQWNKLSPSQRRQFVTAFRSLVEQRYYIRWHREFARGSLHYVGEKSGPDGTVVSTILVIHKEHHNLFWRLRPANGQLMVEDLQVNQKSLSSILAQRFHLLLEKKGFDGLLAWINSHLDTEPSSSKTS